MDLPPAGGDSGMACARGPFMRSPEAAGGAGRFPAESPSPAPAQEPSAVSMGFTLT